MTYYTASEGGASCVAPAAPAPPPLLAALSPFPPPALVPPAPSSPPPGASSLSPSAGNAIVRTFADLAAAVSDPSVSTAILAQHISLQGELYVPGGRTLTVQGSTASCAASGAAPTELAVGLRAVGAVAAGSPGPQGVQSPLCALDAARGGRAFTVAQGGSLTLQSVAVVNGLASGPGGAVFVAGGSLTLSDVQLVSNNARGSGGAISGNQGCTVAIADAVVALNRGGEAGGVYVERCASLVIARSRLVNNTGTAFALAGGALTVALTPRTLFDSITLESNTNVDPSGLGNGGGGVFYTAGTPAGVQESITIRNSVVRRNVGTGGFGGGFCFMSGDAQPTNIGIYNSQFFQNRAVSGAGISLSSASLNLTVVDSLFQSNAATSSGGGAAAYLGIATFIRTQFLGNTVGTGSGGGVRVKSWVQLTFIDCTFTSNVAVVRAPVWCHERVPALAPPLVSSCLRRLLWARSDKRAPPLLTFRRTSVGRLQWLCTPT